VTSTKSSVSNSVKQNQSSHQSAIQIESKHTKQAITDSVKQKVIKYMNVSSAGDSVTQPISSLTDSVKYKVTQGIKAAPSYTQF
jgi:hypothetical protein